MVRLGRDNRGSIHIVGQRGKVTFLTVVVLHWTEHLVQAAQVYAFAMPREKALGILGLWLPGAVTSEWLHYVYNALVLGGLFLLMGRFHGRARLWWTVAIWIQLWHHLEHAILLGQVAIGNNLFGARVPTSLLQLAVPRVELHFAYNLLVTLPIVLAFWHATHWAPLIQERAAAGRPG